MHGFELPVKTVRAARQKKSTIFKSCFFCPREEARRFPDCIPAYGYRRLYLLLFYGKLGQVAVKDAAESGVAAALQGVQVFVRLISVQGGFDLRHGDVGTVIADTLAVGEKIRQDEADLNGAMALLQTGDVIGLDIRHQTVDDLFQGLHLGGHRQVALGVGPGGEGEDLLESPQQDRKLL